MEETPEPTFGEYLHELMQLRNMTVQQLADQIGVSRWLIYKWLEDKEYPSLKESQSRLPMIVNALKPSLAEEQTLRQALKISLLKEFIAEHELYPRKQAPGIAAEVVRRWGRIVQRLSYRRHIRPDRNGERGRAWSEGELVRGLEIWNNAGRPVRCSVDLYDANGRKLRHHHPRRVTVPARGTVVLSELDGTLPHGPYRLEVSYPDRDEDSHHTRVVGTTSVLAADGGLVPLSQSSAVSLCPEHGSHDPRQNVVLPVVPDCFRGFHGALVIVNVGGRQTPWPAVGRIEVLAPRGPGRLLGWRAEEIGRFGPIALRGFQWLDLRQAALLPAGHLWRVRVATEVHRDRPAPPIEAAVEIRTPSGETIKVGRDTTAREARSLVRYMAGFPDDGACRYCLEAAGASGSSS